LGQIIANAKTIRVLMKIHLNKLQAMTMGQSAPEEGEVGRIVVGAPLA